MILHRDIRYIAPKVLEGDKEHVEAIYFRETKMAKQRVRVELSKKFELSEEEVSTWEHYCFPETEDSFESNIMHMNHIWNKQPDGSVELETVVRLELP